MTERVLWQDTAAAGTFGDAPRDCDLVIVGGGFTGLACALFAAQAGLSVTLLEAAQIGAGGSGRNVGLVNAGLWLPPDDLLATLGPVIGPRFLQTFSDAPGLVFELIERHQIRCEARREGTLHAAHAMAGLKGLQARHAAWGRLEAPVDLLDAEAMAEATGTRAFAGGLLDRRAGTVNPMGYARGLARAAQAAGARIIEALPVTALSRDGTGWRIDTGQGALCAGKVVLATNAYSAQLRPEVARCVSIIRYQQVATAPLGARAAHILRGGQGLWDTGLVMRSLRKDAEGRLILGTMGPLHGDAASGASRTWAARRIREWFPKMGNVSFDHAWDGRIAMTPDHLPRILRLDEGLFCPVGYNGRGITTGTVFGRALAEMLAGQGDALPLPLTDPEPIRFRRLRGQAIDLAASVKLRL